MSADSPSTRLRGGPNLAYRAGGTYCDLDKIAYHEGARRDDLDSREVRLAKRAPVT
jgi:hypothetical protein